MQKREIRVGRRTGLGIVVLVMLPVCLGAVDVRTDDTGSRTDGAAIYRNELQSDRPASVGLLALGFGLALAAHTMKRRNS